MKLKKTLAEALLSAFLLRLLITGAHIGDAVALAALVALLGFEMWLEHVKIPDPQKEIKDKVSELDKKVDSVTNKLSAVLAFRSK